MGKKTVYYLPRYSELFCTAVLQGHLKTHNITCSLLYMKLCIIPIMMLIVKTVVAIAQQYMYNNGRKERKNLCTIPIIPASNTYTSCVYTHNNTTE